MGKENGENCCVFVQMTKAWMSEKSHVKKGGFHGAILKYMHAHTKESNIYLQKEIKKTNTDAGTSGHSRPT